jgi:spermidine/putrescine transport system substrate-binding protein
MVKNIPDDWDGLWDESLKGQLLMFNNSRDAYAIAMQQCGITPDTFTKADVDKPSMKAYMLKMMSNLMPESVTQETNPEQLSEMIDGLISNGTLKIDMNSKATYDIGDDGWVKKMVMEMEMTAPGQSTKARQVFTEKE